MWNGDGGWDELRPSRGRRSSSSAGDGAGGKASRRPQHVRKRGCERKQEIVTGARIKAE